MIQNQERDESSSKQIKKPTNLFGLMKEGADRLKLPPDVCLFSNIDGLVLVAFY